MNQIFWGASMTYIISIFLLITFSSVQANDSIIDLILNGKAYTCYKGVNTPEPTKPDVFCFCDSSRLNISVDGVVEELKAFGSSLQCDSVVEKNTHPACRNKLTEFCFCDSATLSRMNREGEVTKLKTFGSSLSCDANLFKELHPACHFPE